MIKSFDDKRTEQVFEGGSPKGFPAELVKRSQTVLDRIDAASTIDDLRVPPSHRLHQMKGNQKGRWSVSVNMQFRITFRFKDGDAYEVRFEDPHK